MDRIKVDSSSLHSLGHDASGSEVQFHAKGCAKLTAGRSGSAKREAPHGGDLPLPDCNCSGGEVYHYPKVSAELHATVLGSQSIGASFARLIKGAKHPETGALLYPATKVTEPVVPELKPV